MEKLMAAPVRNFTVVEVNVRLLGKRQADAGDLGARADHLQCAGKREWGLNILHGKRWRRQFTSLCRWPGV